MMSSPHPTVLAVFAHPDDDALTCLGTLAKFARSQYQVHVLTLTAGEQSTTAVDLVRLSEARSVAQEVGYSLIQHQLSDGKLAFDVHSVSLIEKYIRELLPQIVITHYPQNFGYGHQDHDAVADATVNAARRSSCVDCILYAEPPLQNWGFAPNLFVDVTDYIEIKKHAIRLHHSESGKAYMQPDIAELRARWWALQNHPESYCADRYLESFVLVKGLFGRDIFAPGEHLSREATEGSRMLNSGLEFPARVPYLVTTGSSASTPDISR
ncbi:MAG TPA: PIG-L deacetylase family protein [Ktedonobacteraceae bacterium]|nr:PIG-L deacetylase family protein [Ktedonobacteraceae bacterium]